MDIICAAELAEFTIGAAEDHIGCMAVFGDWRLIKIFRKRKLKICVFYSQKEETYCLVNPGTEFGFTRTFLDNCVNNLLQPFGASSDMKNSLFFAEKFYKKHKKKKIIFVGHSKGGAEAMANAVSVNCDCIVFNPAVVNLRAYGLEKKRQQYTAKMLSFVVEGEFLSVFRNRKKNELAQNHFLPAPYKSRKRSDRFNNHTMYAVCRALRSDFKDI